MKRIIIFVTTLAFLAILTQCKKEEQVTPTNESGTVAITLDIKGNNGTRMNVNTGTGEVTYEEGDVVYVVSGGKYIGTLMHNGTNFNGIITDPTVGEPLYFYFLGNVTPVETLTAGTTQSCSVIISDQTERLPVIECAPSNETYISGVTTFTAMLLNKCALVKFNVVTASEAAICVTGFNNKVTIDFSNVSFTYGMIDEGNITLPAGSGEKWAILLPQEAMEAGAVGSAYSVDGAFTGICNAVPAITENGYLTEGIEVTVTTVINPGEVPVGAINGKFTINENGNQVYFSKGNLQYIGSASTPYWKFADHQWDYYGTTTGQNSANENVDRDLFGWGTSGYDHGAICYQPWSTSTNYSDYFAYGLYNSNLYDQTGQADWGYNAISNGGNQENCGWRTLTQLEWDYVFNTRNTASGIRYVLAKVNDINGVILLPDNWITSIYSLCSYYGYSANTITADDWINILEASGAIFLPAAGGRWGTSVSTTGNTGIYGSASYYDRYNSYFLYFEDYYYSNIGCSTWSDDGGLGYGLSVRLVRNAE